jgi:hypothetical protein
LSDLARESLKDPSGIDFLGVGVEAQERVLEEANEAVEKSSIDLAAAERQLQWIV